MRLTPADRNHSITVADNLQVQAANVVLVIHEAVHQREFCHVGAMNRLKNEQSKVTRLVIRMIQRQMPITSHAGFCCNGDGKLYIWL